MDTFPNGGCLFFYNFTFCILNFEFLFVSLVLYIDLNYNGDE